MNIAKDTRHPARTIEPGEAVPPAEPGRDYNPVITPNGVTLPCKVVDGIKVFHLVAQEVTHEFAPGLKTKLWGFNGRAHGPTIEAVEGDFVRIYVTNKLSEATSIHWHGIVLPNGMDGVGGLNQKTIGPGETFKYEYPLVQYGTYMYHSGFHELNQMALGLMGLFIIHPRRPAEPPPDRDFAILLSEWDIKPGRYRPDPDSIFNFTTFTFNAKAFPATESLVARRGDRVRIRLVNRSAVDHHPIHLNGHSFWVTQTDGGVIPPSARWPETTVLVAAGQSRTIDFVADNPGDWALHSQMTSDTVNQLGSNGPILVGVDTAKLARAIKPLIPDFKPTGAETSDQPTSMGSKGGNGKTARAEASNAETSNHEQEVPTPDNSIAMESGNGPYGDIDMGGMFTVLKGREDLISYANPGWYRPPRGTVAHKASKQDLERDGIHVGRT
jgi:hypothetical protein